MKLSEWNRLPARQAEDQLLQCCGSQQWARSLIAIRPFGRAEDLYELARSVWRALPEGDQLEAYAAHPRIGEKVEGPEQSRQWSRREQSGVASADTAVREALARGNRRYQERFGFIYLVCASGRDAGELLSLLQKRLGNTREEELRIAAREQEKITRLRLERMFETEDH